MVVTMFRYCVTHSLSDYPNMHVPFLLHFLRVIYDSTTDDFCIYKCNMTWSRYQHESEPFIILLNRDVIHFFNLEHLPYQTTKFELSSIFLLPGLCFALDFIVVFSVSKPWSYNINLFCNVLNDGKYQKGVNRISSIS